MGCQGSKTRVNAQANVSMKLNEHNTQHVRHNEQYDKIDAHARKAPSSLKNSVEDLVNYISSVSKEPRILARGFFVWISENIRYDADGFFGRTQRAANDALSVMKGGKSVCEGYANVMEILCNQANIPVKKISGYAKGYGYSASRPFSLSDATDHAWNAIQLEGKWYLLDSTWGAGHLDSSNTFKKEFRDFYFLPDPKHLITTHFPYMDNNLEESKKWQLLSKPLSLEEFNKNVKYKPEAFELGVQAVSHPMGFIEMKNELSIVFKSTKQEELVLSGRLMLEDGNMLRDQRNAVFGQPDADGFKLLVHPPKVGLYELSIFGQTASDEKLEGIPEVLEYTIRCTAATETDFEYPSSYHAAGMERTVLHEPLRGKLPANKAIKFRIYAPFLNNVMVGEEFLEKSGNIFSGEAKSGSAGRRLVAYGTRGDRHSRMQGLYEFTVC